MHEARPDLDPLGIASLHATVLAIVIGIYAAYGLYIYTTVDQMRTTAFQAAAKVNELPWVGSVNARPNDIKAAKTSKGRALLLERLEDAADEMGSGDAKVRIRVANRMLGLMSVIISTYPFPTYRPGGAVSTPVHFKTSGDLREWGKAVSDVARAAYLIRDVRRSSFDEILREFAREQNKIFGRPPRALPPEAHGVLSPGEQADLKRYAELQNSAPMVFANSFFRNVYRAEAIARTVKSNLDNADSASQRYTPKGWSITVLVGAVFAFALGVVIPLWKRKVRPVISVWLPMLYYFLVLLAFASRILKT